MVAFTQFLENVPDPPKSILIVKEGLEELAKEFLQVQG